jgi:hypothetical protein
LLLVFRSRYRYRRQLVGDASSITQSYHDNSAPVVGEGGDVLRKLLLVGPRRTRPLCRRWIRDLTWQNPLEIELVAFNHSVDA